MVAKNKNIIKAITVPVFNMENKSIKNKFIKINKYINFSIDRCTKITSGDKCVGYEYQATACFCLSNFPISFITIVANIVHYLEDTGMDYTMDISRGIGVTGKIKIRFTSKSNY